jgi:hypothetical protein
MGRSGQAITLISAVDLPKWQAIERGLGVRLPRLTADGKTVTTPSRQPRPAAGGAAAGHGAGRLLSGVS